MGFMSTLPIHIHVSEYRIVERQRVIGVYVYIIRMDSSTIYISGQ